MNRIFSLNNHFDSVPMLYTRVVCKPVHQSGTDLCKLKPMSTKPPGSQWLCEHQCCIPLWSMKNAVPLIYMTVLMI